MYIAKLIKCVDIDILGPKDIVSFVCFDIVGVVLFLFVCVFFVVLFMLVFMKLLGFVLVFLLV